MKKLAHVFRFCENMIINKINYLNTALYMKQKYRYLKKIGIQIEGKLNYVDPSVYFDSTDYSLIRIGDATTISREVMFLTHDFSINKGLQHLGYSERGKFVKPITIGENCFIGARVALLPGTIIGDNVIVGACSVVKGNIPSNSIVVGNPCEVVGDIKGWAKKHYELKDYEIL